MKKRIKPKMMNPMTPLSRGDATHEMKMFLVSSQLTESKPFADIVKPIMHPITVWVVDTGSPKYVATNIINEAVTKLVNIPSSTISGSSV
mmetsp:Transcript_13022/g.28544  ORF Transcript_13022/g.28544 Transcript_13022/m.28544 type:complete len:90 (+) Transcript_13022:799-1068(+)